MLTPPRLVIVDCDAWSETTFLGTLAPEEVRRAERYQRAIERHRFVVRRGILRRLLAECLGIEPAAVPLVAAGAGKPCIDRTAGALAAAAAARRGCDIPGFNLSRSGPMALVALAMPSGPATGAARTGPAIGVDLEAVACDRRSREDLLRIGDRFAPAETHWLAALPAAEATAAFYRLWTCKEACLKSLGTGIGAGVPSLADVACVDPPSAALTSMAWRDGGIAWHVRCFAPAPGHAAAVALPTSAGDLPTRVSAERLEPAAAERRVMPAVGPPPARAPEGP